MMYVGSRSKKTALLLLIGIVISVLSSCNADSTYLPQTNTDITYEKTTIADTSDTGITDEITTEEKNEVTTGAKMENINDIVSIISFNLYWNLAEDYERAGRVFSVIDEYSPDILCVQEETAEWQTYMESHMNSKYDHVGILRMITEGEGCRIYYLKSKFTLIDSGTIWLTETPDVMSKTEGADHYRICTYAILVNNITGKKFMVTNIHTENGSTVWKIKARASQWECFIDFLKKYENLPRISAGDYNTEEGSLLYNHYIRDNSLFCDAKFSAKKTKIIDHTYHGFDDDPDKYEMIDYFLVSPDIVVNSYTVIDMLVDGKFPSDHYPLMIEVEA